MSKTPKDALDRALREDLSASEQDELLESPFSFVQLALAKNAASTADTLKAVLRKPFSTFDEGAMLLSIASHPNASSDVLRDAVNRVKDALDSGKRPYAALIQLAQCNAVPHDAIESLLAHAGVSSRTRARGRRALEARDDLIR